VNSENRAARAAINPERTVAPLRVGLIGFPIAHSISPAMQQPAFDALGIPAQYELWPTPADELKARIDGLKQAGFLGANVTVPHKQAVIPFLDHVSALAARAGAVNTIVNADGRLTGHNTDVHGLADSLRRHAPNLESSVAAVLGAGGAARAAVLALESLGVSRIAVLNRSLNRARTLAADLLPAQIEVIESTPGDRMRVLGEAELLINATALGWNPGESPLSIEEIAALDRSTLVLDLTYRETDLLRRCLNRGLEAIDGLEMLVFQGARAFELWTGQPGPVDLMIRAAIAARASRP
jgi:shikimate dehydrogenase